LNLFRISSNSAECPAHPSFQALPQYCLAGTKYRASHCTVLCTSQEYPLSSLYIFTWTSSKSRLDYVRSIIFLYGVNKAHLHTF